MEVMIERCCGIDVHQKLHEGFAFQLMTEKNFSRILHLSDTNPNV